ncbi:protein ref(2)P [Echria macrotheca]|uniref:Protein ref(2)P n=1 Tax=Echria macrotheca TaxID=438768 RepID=A0AAJ0BDT3_9PEZI|nr:protein ref(2)P [Echria macrotheca]
MDSSNTASTLTRHRVGVALFSVAAAASIGYAFYRRSGSELTPPDHGQPLRRSNAVRHRRGYNPNSIPEAPESHDSDGSWTSLGTPPADENADNTIRPVTDGETVAESHVMEDEWWSEPPEMANQRSGHNIVSLLFRVSEDNARRNACIHRGCQCNACGVVPIRGVRYRCANCSDFDLCETCESQGLHFKTHIFYKIKVPAPRLGARQMQPVLYPGDPENCRPSLPRQLLTRLSKETGYERPELDALWEQWTFMANTEWREDPDNLNLAMDRQTFERYLVPSGGSKQGIPNLLNDRIFAFYDTNNDDLIGFSEFLHATSYRKRKDRLRKLFEGYDVDRDGFVDRRDFLRLFRAYYVLFKQMHRDITEGLDEQALNSSEAQRLITSRQPLSSHFGREERIPFPDPDRPLEGKVVNSNNGDVHISDGSNRAVKEDRSDTADRESMLSSLFSKATRRGDSTDTRFLHAILNPTTHLNELQALLAGDPRNGDEVLVVLNEVDGAQDESSSGQEDDSGGALDDRAQGQSGEPWLQDASPHVGRVDSTSQGENGGTEAQWPGTQRAFPATSSRRTRANARRRLLDRWRDRRFYLDEEEGGLAPEGWKDEYDVLARLDGNAESSKSAQPPISPRSRSSSKVRFAEDTDDYEVRSNPSTSSRSIPERWGGMDIPDAERDAGKEVFYQVIQQAFNEILDILFKAKEDLAVQAAETKDLRDKHRPLFQSIDIQEDVKDPARPSVVVDSNRPVSERSLPELLAISGYTVESPRQDWGTDSACWSNTDTKVEEPRAEEGVVEEGENADDLYRDPTMPQFRPNSASQSEHGAAGSFGGAKAAKSEDLEKESISTSKGKTVKVTTGPAKGDKSGESSSLPTPIPAEMLIKWKKLDDAEQEAKARGGWGKLSFEEFEEIYRSEESTGNRLDYLGTWVDFCIPFY